MKKRTKLLWIKWYHQDWRDSTRSMSPSDRALLFDVIMLMVEYEGPIFDDAKWIAHQLHVSVPTWVAARKRLIANGKISLVDGHLTNARALVEIEERALKCATNKRIAIDRERRKSSAQSGDDLETQRTEVGDFGERDPGSAEANANSQSKSNDGGARCVKRTLHHAHARENHHHQIKNENENSSLVSDHQEPKSGDFSIVIDDDDDGSRPVRRVPASLVKELALREGDVRANEIVSEYEASDYAHGAKVLGKAFIGWVGKTYGIRISGRGCPLSLGELQAIGGTDARGVALPLPKNGPSASRAIWRAAHE